MQGANTITEDQLTLLEKLRFQNRRRHDVVHHRGAWALVISSDPIELSPFFDWTDDQKALEAALDYCGTMHDQRRHTRTVFSQCSWFGAWRDDDLRVLLEHCPLMVDLLAKWMGMSPRQILTHTVSHDMVSGRLKDWYSARRDQARP